MTIGESAEDRYWYSDGEEKIGPLSREELESKIASGEVGQGDLIWEKGTVEWRPAKEVFDFPEEPPPLPSQEGSNPSRPDRLIEERNSGNDRAARRENDASDETQVQPVGFGEWMWTLLVGGIPFLNIVAYLVWAFNGSTNPSKSNWAKATLTWLAVFLVPFSILLSKVDGLNSPTGINAESEVQGQEQMTQSQSETETGSRELQEDKQTSNASGQKGDNPPITLDDFETDPYGEPGGKIRTWKETALRSSPVSSSESIIRWISKGEVLENAQKSGEYYRVEYKGRDGYVLEYNIKPDDRF